MDESRIIKEIRMQLAPFLGETHLATQSSLMPARPHYEAFERMRMLRKIPDKNYAKLPKEVPISWI